MSITRSFLFSVFALGLMGNFALPGSALAQSQPATDGTEALDQLVTPPNQAQDINRQVSDQAFNMALDQALPLRPDQIQQLIARMSAVQDAAAPTLRDPSRPTPVMKVETVSLDPSGQPPVLMVAAGYVTSVMLMDATGAPWPISDLAFAGKFEASIPTNSQHVLRIIPLNRFQEGNITIQLKDLATPVTIRLVAGKDEVYYRYDMRIPAMGPNARAPRFESANSLVGGDSVMMAVLDGYPPAGAKRLQVSGVDDRTAAWDVNGQTYLRSPHSLLSPAWSSSTTSGDGTTVYAIESTPVLLMSDHGVMVRARLSRPEGITAGESNNGN